MFQVFDNGKPADCDNHMVDKSWKQSVYPTFAEAEAYALSWLDIMYSPGPGVLQLDVPYYYSGCGDTIEIRDVPRF